MSKVQVVLDTNILISALRSQAGAAYKLLMLVGQADFEINLSVSLMLEYEDVAKRLLDQIPLTENDIDDILDYLCQTANRREVFYLWRPYLKDPKDDMVLEVAVSGGCEVIITYNGKDFVGIEQFGLEAMTPIEFLRQLGVSE